MYICSLIAQARIYKFAPNLVYLRHGRDFKRTKLRTIILTSSIGEGDSCDSETKHDSRTVPRPKLFVSVSRLQEYNPVKSWVPVTVLLILKSDLGFR
jgi:hypothetical protein